MGGGVNGGLKAKALRIAAKTPLRVRLILSFVILIVSSASATIAIGNTVFGSKIQELAGAMAADKLEHAEHRLSEHQLRLGLIARSLADRADFPAAAPYRITARADPRDWCAGVPGETSADFIVTGEGTETEIFQCAGVNAKRADPTVGPLPPAAVELLDDAARLNGVQTYPLLLAAELRALGYADPPEEGMLIAAAAVGADGRRVLVGLLLNAGRALVESLLTPEEVKVGRGFAAALFLHDTRIAAFNAVNVLGSKVDQEIADRVLNQGRDYIGASRVKNVNYYAAYAPLRDHRGRIIGMLGAGLREELHDQARRHRAFHQPHRWRHSRTADGRGGLIPNGYVAAAA